MNFRTLKITTICLVLSVISVFANPGQKNFFNFKKAKLKTETKGITSVIIVYKDQGAGTTAKFSQRRTSNVKDLMPKLKPVFPKTQLKRVMQSKNGKLSRAAQNIRNMYSAELAKGADIVEVLEKLNSMPEVKYAEPNYPVELFSAPNDTFYNIQWDLNNTGQTFPKSFSQGESTGTPGADISWQDAYQTGMPSAEIIVGVIDTGVDYTHLDLTNRMWRNNDEIINGIDDDFNGYVDDVHGINVAYGTGDPMDDHGHGTHVAGIVAAEVNNNYGICGVNPNAKIMALKFSDSTGRSTTANSIECVTYAASMGAKVLNCSWGGGSYSIALVDAFEFANELGCAVVCASGNSGELLNMYPAGYYNTVSVAASDAKDELAYFSNYGPWIDVTAPGEDILSLKASQASISGFSNNFLIMNGTSMASPVAAGVLSLLMSSNPGHHPFLYKNVLKKSCDDIYNVGGNTNFAGYLGGGRINIVKALAYDETNAFIDARIEPTSSGSIKISPGKSARLFVTAGLWKYDMDNLTIRFSDKTSGIIFPKGSTYNLGNLPGYFVTNLPEDTFTVKIDEGTTYGSTESFVVELLHNGTVIDNKKIYIQVFNTDFSIFTVADIDNDGIKEVLGTLSSILYCFDSSAVLKWATLLPYNALNQASDISAGDFNGDGTNEIVVAVMGPMGYGKLNFIYGDGTYWKNFSDFSQYYNVNVEDLNHDGKDDVIAQVYSGNRTLTAYDVSADNILWSQGPMSATEPTVGDIDGDGVREIVYYEFPGNEDDDYAFLKVIDFAGNEITKYCYTVDFFDRFVGSPSLGDFDGNGTLDIIATDSSYEGMYSVIFDIVEGKIFPGYPKKLNIDNRANVLADLDDDGKLEIIGVDGDAGALRAVHYDGSPVPGFPVFNSHIYSINSVVVADVNDDYKPDIIYMTEVIPVDEETEEYTVVARDANGMLVQGFPKKVTQPYQGSHGNIFSVAVDWLEPSFDGTDPELLIFSAAEAGVNYYSPGASFSEFANDWPTAKHDWQHSGCYKFNSVNLLAKFFSTNRFGTGTLSTDFSSEIFGKNQNGLQYFWDFDNNGTIDSTNANPDYSYSAVGVYSVSLTVSNAAGEGFTSLREDYIEVYPASGLVADFSADIVSGDAPLTISFTDESLYHPETWEWDFDNNGTIDSTEQNPDFLYTNSGTFSVKLTVKNKLNGIQSSDSIIKTNFINLVSVMNNVTNHYVSPKGSHSFPFKNWDEAATNIQAAVDVATDGHNVIIGNGVYSRFDSAYDNVVIKSENGPDVTIIDGQGKENCMNFNNNIVLDGLTFRNGFAGDGGAISAYGCTGIIQNCIFYNNKTKYFDLFIGYGGAIRAGYPTAQLASVLTIKNSVFYSNTAKYGGAIFESSKGEITVSRCTFFDNNSANSAAAVAGGNIYNSLFYNNSGEVIVGTYGEVNNCTFVSNTSEFGALDAAGSVINNIVYNNSGDGGNIRQKYTNAFILNNCAAPAGIAGSGNIASDPQFVNPALNDYRVFGSSPCVDGGSNYHERAFETIKTVFVDFGLQDNMTSGNWNNLTNYHDGSSIANAVSSNGTLSGISVTISNFYGAIGCDAVCIGSPFPPSAEQDNFVASVGENNGGFIYIEGLVPGRNYDFTFFGIFTNNAYNGCYFDINGTFVDTYNFNRTNFYSPAAKSIIAPGDGKVIIRTWAYPADNYASIGILAINEKDYIPVGPVIPSSQLDLPGTNRIINQIVDIGAYEFTGGLAPVAVAKKVGEESRMNHPIAFSADGSYDPDGTIADYSWNFGDGFTTNGTALTNVTHNFAAADFRIITLTVTDNSGQKGSDNINLNILPEVPDAPTDLSVTNDAAKTVSVVWNDNSDDEDGFVIQRYTLDYPAVEVIIDDEDYDNMLYESGGDWRTKSVSSAYKGSFHYLYSTKTLNYRAFCNPKLQNEGLYEIFIRWPHPTYIPKILGSTTFAQFATIIVHHANGQKTFIYNTRVNGDKWNSFGIIKMNPGSYIEMDLPFSDATVPIDAFKFVKVSEFVNAGSAPANSTNFIDTNIEQGKIYSYRVFATNNFGYSLPSNEDTVLVDFTNQIPVAVIDSVDPSSANFQALVSVVGSGIDTDGTISNYKWDFGDGYSGSIMEGAALSNAAYTYRHIGDYTISLTVYDNEGRASTNIAVASVSISGAVPAPTTNLVAKLDDKTADAIALTWEGNMVHEDGFKIQRKFDSGSFIDYVTTPKGIKYYSDTDVYQGHTYTYRVRAYNEYGASDWSNEDSVYVPVLPVATILSPNAATSDVPDLVINFIAEAAAGDNAITNLQWNFGDGSINTNGGLQLTNIVHTYTIEGVYTAVFSVVDLGGFGAEDSVKIEVIPEAMGIVFSMIALCALLRRDI